MKWLTLILQWLPSVLATVVGIENAIGSQPGATKKQVAMAVLTAGAQGASKIPDASVQAVAGLVDTVVTALNTSGVFGTSTSTTVAKVGPTV